MSISGSIVKKIVNAFIDAFPTREKLVIMLRYQLNITESYVPNGSNYNITVFQLVDDFDSKGKIIDLIKAACEESSDNQNLQSVKQKIIPIIKLYQILAPLEKDFIKQIEIAYKSCCPEDWHLDEESVPHNLQQVLDNLEEMPWGNNDYSRTAQFVAYLLVNISSQSPIVDELKKWSESYVQDFSQLLDKTNAGIKNKQDKPEDILSYLIVKVEQSKQYKKRYRVSTWFIPDSNDGKVNKSTGEGYLPVTIKELQEQEVFYFKEIRSLLQSLLIQVSEQPTFSSYHTTLEFFLPQEKLNEAIDSWEIKASKDGKPRPIGISYKISVRSNERLTQSLYKNDWKNKWDLLQQQNTPQCFLTGDDHSEEKLIRMLKPYSALALKFKKPPSRAIFEVINETAIPVALWIRQEMQNLDIQYELDDLLQCPITKLPEQVKEKRLEAFAKGKESQSHFGSHISLLWENPNVLPPSTNTMEYTQP